MSNETGFFSGRYWHPASIVGVLLFLSLSVFIGYQLWINTNSDLRSVQKINELQLRSANISPLSSQAIVGNADGLKSLASTVGSIDSVMTALLNNNVVSKAGIDGQYESASNFWLSIKKNSSVLIQSGESISLANLTSQQLDDAAIESQNIVAGAIEKAALKGASKEQITALSMQSLLLREMASQMKIFAGESTSASESFDRYQEALVAFERNYRALLDGDDAQAISPLRSADIRADVDSVYSLIDTVRGSETELINAVESLLLARDARNKISSSLSGFRFALNEMIIGIDSQAGNRFPQPILLVLSLIALLASVYIFLTTFRLDSQEVNEADLSETENAQAAILRLLDELADLADGDLTVTTTVSEDFTGAIADSVNYTIDQLRQLVSRINRTAMQVSGAAQESQQTALHLAEASDHQAQEIAGASAAINEMAVTIDQVSANAAESALVASKSVSIANNGAKLVQNTIHGMDTIREQIQDTSKRIKRLGESSQEIGDIVSLINDIADQTNILALNAAIQASMAGDAGRGFAVVADEVQRLAERSAAATKQIETLVKTIQTDTNEAVISMEQTTTEVVSGARLAQDAGVALEEIEGVSANIAELIQNISNAARQQASSAGHISNTMNVIQEITSQTSAGTGATAHAIGDLADMALELRESVAGFKLPEDMDVSANDSDTDFMEDSWLSADDVGDSEADEISSFDSEPSGGGEFELSDSLLKASGSGVSQLFADSEDEFELAATQNTVSSSNDNEFDLSIDDELSFIENNFDDDLSMLSEISEADSSLDSDLDEDEFDLSAFDFTDEELDSVR